MNGENAERLMGSPGRPFQTIFRVLFVFLRVLRV